MIRASIPQHLHPVLLGRERRRMVRARAPDRRGRGKSRGSRGTRPVPARNFALPQKITIFSRPCISVCPPRYARYCRPPGRALALFSSRTLPASPRDHHQSRCLREFARKAAIVPTDERVAFVRHPHMCPFQFRASPLPWYVRKKVLSSLVSRTKRTISEE